MDVLNAHGIPLSLHLLRTYMAANSRSAAHLLAAEREKRHAFETVGWILGVFPHVIYITNCTEMLHLPLLRAAWGWNGQAQLSAACHGWERQAVFTYGTIFGIGILQE